MKYSILTDTHFGHEASKKFCGRPDNFEDKILAGAYNNITTGQVFIHLGDFCWGNDQNWHDLFFRNCKAKKKWLIRGNHDKKTNSWYLNHGWDFVSERIDLKMYGKEIILTHKPIEHFDNQNQINIHGHCHNIGHHPEHEATGQHKLLFIEDGCKYGDSYSPFNLRTIVENNQ